MCTRYIEQDRVAALLWINQNTPTNTHILTYKAGSTPWDRLMGKEEGWLIVKSIVYPRKVTIMSHHVLLNLKPDRLKDLSINYIVVNKDYRVCLEERLDKEISLVRTFNEIYIYRIRGNNL